jgi:two-component system OmpR family response regulator
MPTTALLNSGPGDATLHFPLSPGNPGAEGLAKVHDTARSIEDRIRRVLLPPDSAIATLRFLVVDDLPDAADALAAVLELLGCSVRSCLDGWSALRIAEEFDPQVCLIDVRMPGMDGLELAARLKVWATNRPLLLIATTALSQPTDRERTALAGFHEHLVKPVDIPTLIEAITRLWEIVVRQSSKAPPRSPES